MCQLASADALKNQILKPLFIGALKKKKEEKDSQYKHKRPMAIAIGLIYIELTVHWGIL